MLPDGGEVLFPIIKQITFKDPVDRGQETTYSIDNTEQSDRDTHIAFVGPAPDATEDGTGDTPSDCIAVERIDQWRVKDAVDRGQQTHQSLDSKTYDPDGPPFFTNHAETHVLRVKNDPDDGYWIETEVIDKLYDKDAVGRGQQTQYELLNPIGDDDGDGNMVITANTDDDEEDDSGGDVDPPWRTDPFQNIIKINSGPFWEFTFLRFGFSGGLGITSFDPGATATRNLDTATIRLRQPLSTPVPGPPPISAFTFDSSTNYPVTGWPSTVTFGSPPSGYNGPFLATVGGGAYFITITTIYLNASPPFDAIPGPAATLDFSSISITFGCGGPIWLPVRLDNAPYLTPTGTIGQGIMTMAPNFGI